MEMSLRLVIYSCEIWIVETDYFFGIDLKNGFAFVKLDGGHHEAFAKLNDSIFNERKIRVEFAKGAERTARQQSKRKHQEPSRILFVANFGPRMTERGLEALFAKHGKVVRSSIDERKRSFGFVEFDRLDDAVSAQKEMDNSPFEERVLTVEFSEGPIRRRSPPRRRHDDSPRRRRSSPRRHHHDDRDYRRSRSRSRYA
jgi:RNA recognition motif-containing protein